MSEYGLHPRIWTCAATLLLVSLCKSSLGFFLYLRDWKGIILLFGISQISRQKIHSYNLPFKSYTNFFLALHVLKFPTKYSGLSWAQHDGQPMEEDMLGKDVRILTSLGSGPCGSWCLPATYPHMHRWVLQKQHSLLSHSTSEAHILHSLKHSNIVQLFFTSLTHRHDTCLWPTQTCTGGCQDPSGTTQCSDSHYIWSKHPSIYGTHLSYIGHFFSNHWYSVTYVVMEYVPGKDLEMFLMKIGNLEKEEDRPTIHQVMSVVHFLKKTHCTSWY